MNRKELAGFLLRAADLMEVCGEEGFRPTAYRRAARTLERYEGEFEALANNAFHGVAGIGPGLSTALSEIYASGEFPYLDELIQRVPLGVQELFSVQGLGPKRIRALWRAGVDSIESLVDWAASGRIAALSGFGRKTEQGLLEAARFALVAARRVHLSLGQVIAERLLLDLSNAGIQAEVAGSVRRHLETVSGVDLVARAGPEVVRRALGEQALDIQGERVLGRAEGLSLVVHCAGPADFGRVLLKATGSSSFVHSLGTPLPEAPDEESCFEALARTPIPAYWREQEHLGKHLPKTPLEPGMLKGMIHTHSSYSDGANTIREMAAGAIERGYQYLLISDHSQSAGYAGGLSAEDLKRQWVEIEALNIELAPFRILKGIESDILPDGRLDYPEELLRSFDLVIGSLHSGLGLPAEAQTERMLKVIENPYLSILGHLTGRLLLRRPEARADWPRVLEAAARLGVIVEINANPWRLDLDWRLALARRDSLYFSLGPDAHLISGLDDMAYGVWMAQKAGLEAGRVMNTWSLERLLAYGEVRRNTR